MTMMQDPTHPTGVVDTNGRGGSALANARLRKSKAALSMRRNGDDWATIAKALGYPTPRAALVATEQALAAELSTRESQEFMRDMASDQLLSVLKPVLKAARNPNDPNWLHAVDRVRGLLRDHAELMGYISPKKHGIDSPTLAYLERWVASVTQMGGPDVEEADIFGDGADIIDAEVVEDEDAAPAG